MSRGYQGSSRPSSARLAPRVRIADLELIDKTGDYDVFMRVAVQIGDNRSSVYAGRHLCRPFELYVLWARAFARFLVTAAILRQARILERIIQDMQSVQLPLELIDVLSSCPIEKFICTRLDLMITCQRVAQLPTRSTTEKREQDRPEKLHNIDTVVCCFRNGHEFATRAPT